MSPLLLIDAGSLLYRAYHAIPSLKAADGVTETNAVHGFLNFLARLITDRRPSRLVVALDADWRPAFRVDALPTYKTHRVAAEGSEPDEVERQLPLFLDVLSAMGISVAEADGYEAEDVIATLAERADRPVEVVTGDRDLFALVKDGRVRVLYTLRGVSELAVVDEAYVAAKYGIPGDRYLDFAILRGDPSDGLPGVAGIGEKTASQLVARHGSLDAILAAPDLSPTIRARLNRAADYLAAAMRVVAPVRDCPVRGGDGTLPGAPADPRRLADLAERFRLAGPLERVREAIAAAPV
ncbi:MAG TPA: 5'-3' exonuclease [Candidatus Limnocylindrales bacterium]|nr:5'-3' exonuclease [Candidatus Limnocylindrales bacterium]